MQQRTVEDLLAAMTARETILFPVEQHDTNEVMDKLLDAALHDLENSIDLVDVNVQLTIAGITQGIPSELVFARLFLLGIEIGREMERWAAQDA